MLFFNNILSIPQLICIADMESIRKKNIELSCTWCLLDWLKGCTQLKGLTLKNSLWMLRSDYWAIIRMVNELWCQFSIASKALHQHMCASRMKSIKKIFLSHRVHSDFPISATEIRVQISKTRNLWLSQIFYTANDMQMCSDSIMKKGKPHLSPGIISRSVFRQSFQDNLHSRQFQITSSVSGKTPFCKCFSNTFLDWCKE